MISIVIIVILSIVIFHVCDGQSKCWFCLQLKPSNDFVFKSCTKDDEYYMLDIYLCCMYRASLQMNLRYFCFYRMILRTVDTGYTGEITDIS